MTSHRVSPDHKHKCEYARQLLAQSRVGNGGYPDDLITRVARVAGLTIDQVRQLGRGR